MGNTNDEPIKLNPNELHDYITQRVISLISELIAMQVVQFELARQTEPIRITPEQIKYGQWIKYLVVDMLGCNLQDYLDLYFQQREVEIERLHKLAKEYANYKNG